MTTSTVSRYLVLAIVLLSHYCILGYEAFPLKDAIDNENHNMLRRSDTIQDMDFGFEEDMQQRRELWGFSSMLYHLGVCPGPKICGPPPCHGPNPKPEHWHCNITAFNATEDTAEETYAFSSEAESGSQAAPQNSSSAPNFWLYIVGAAVAVALIAGLLLRKKNARGEHLLHSSVGKRLGIVGGEPIQYIPASPHPSFVEMPPQSRGASSFA